MNDLAVVIVSWNVQDLLRTCLHTLFEDIERSHLTARVWVVDNNSADGSAQMVAESFPQVHLIASQENLGFVGGNNLALDRLLASEVPGPGYVWLLNPDTEVEPGATAALVSTLESHPRVGVVGAGLRYPDGSLQHSGFRFPGLVQLASDLFPLPTRLYDTPLNGRYARRRYEGAEPFPIDFPLGAAMMVRREAIDRVGLMDEGFWMYCEEIDWCWRMRKAGWRALCMPAARVVHHAGQSSAQVRTSSFTNLWTSRARLYARHHGPIRYRLARALVRTGMRRRARGAAPEMVTACERVRRAWEEAEPT